MFQGLKYILLYFYLFVCIYFIGRVRNLDGHNPISQSLGNHYRLSYSVLLFSYILII